MAIHIGRRELIVTLGGVAAWPLAARAQQTGRLPIIGFLGTDASVWSTFTAAFVARLRELGWIEGRTIVIEYRWDEGGRERVAEIAAEFVRMKVDATAGGARQLASLPRQRREFITCRLHTMIASYGFGRQTRTLSPVRP